MNLPWNPSIEHLSIMILLWHQMLTISWTKPNKIIFLITNRSNSLYYMWTFKNSPRIKIVHALHSTSYFVFHADCYYLGKILLKNSTSEHEEIIILQQNIPLDQFPQEILPRGLDAQRQWYLYGCIRHMCVYICLELRKSTMSSPRCWRI